MLVSHCYLNPNETAFTTDNEIVWTGLQTSRLHKRRSRSLFTELRSVSTRGRVESYGFHVKCRPAGTQSVNKPNNCAYLNRDVITFISSKWVSVSSPRAFVRVKVSPKIANEDLLFVWLSPYCPESDMPGRLCIRILSTRLLNSSLDQFCTALTLGTKGNTSAFA